MLDAVKIRNRSSPISPHQLSAEGPARDGAMMLVSSLISIADEPTSALT
jgi:hypothetical protein